MPHEWSQSDSRSLAEVKRDVHHMQNNMKQMSVNMSEMSRELNARMDKLVTYVEFNPIKLVVYGLVAIMLTAVISALVATVTVTAP